MTVCVNAPQATNRIVVILKHCGKVRNTIDAPFYGAKATALQSELDLSAGRKPRSRGSPFTLERIRFELNHERALSFCFDAFSSREPVSTSLENALVA
jgi:hypothetical protein